MISNLANFKSLKFKSPLSGDHLTEYPNKCFQRKEPKVSHRDTMSIVKDTGFQGGFLNFPSVRDSVTYVHPHPFVYGCSFMLATFLINQCAGGGEHHGD